MTTYKEIYESLSKVDFTKKTDGPTKTGKKGQFTYVKWAYAVDEFNKRFPQHHVEFPEHKIKTFANGTQEIYCKVSVDECYKEIWFPVTKSDSKTPLINGGCYDMNTNKMRAMVKCMALFGLGIQVYKDGTTVIDGNPPEKAIINPILLDVRDAKKQGKLIDDLFKKGELSDGKTDEMEFGTALQPEIVEKEHPFVPNNMRASNFGRYAFGLGYTSGKYKQTMKTRLEQLEMDLAGETKDISDIPHVKYGVHNERCGIAKWMLINGEACLDYCDGQKNYKTKPFYKGIVLSATPDGLSKDGKTVIEVKCSSSGEKTYDEFPKQYLPQIMGQMCVLNQQGVNVEQVDLVNWTPIRTRLN